MNDKCVVEKLIIKAPYKYAAIFQNEACFLYLKDGQTSINTPTDKINIDVTESVLLKCGNYFANLIQKNSSNFCEIYAVHLYPEILREIYKDEIPAFIKNSANKKYFQKFVKQGVITNYIESLTFYFDNPSLINSDLLILKLKELILLLLQTESSETVLSLFEHLFTPRKVNLTEILQIHLFSDLSVDELATLAGRSLSSFKRDFKIQYSDTPANYIKDKKLERALELLTATDSSISEICYQVGFNDAAHFTRIFKLKYKKTPSSYRNSPPY